MEIEDINTPDIFKANKYGRNIVAINDISSDISELLDVSTKTSSIIDNGIHVNNISDIIEYLNKIIPLIQKLNVSQSKKILLSLDETRKELSKDKTVGTVLRNPESIFTPLNSKLDSILSYLKEEKAPIVNVASPIVNVEKQDAPIVNIPAPIVNVPETVVNIPKSPAPIVNIDLDKLINSLEESLKPIIYNTEINPLAVRLSDGEKWIDELRVLQNKIAEQTQYIPNAMFIKSSGSGIINPARDESVSIPTSIGNGSTRVTTAGVRTKISQVSYPTKYVIITANASNVGRIWVGGYTISANNGRPLESSESERFEIDDVSKIYIDADVDGEGVSYTFASSLSTVPAYLLGEDGFPILNETGEYVLTEY